MIKSKFMIIALVILAVFVILLVIGRKSIHAEITIKASPETVWENLTDVSKVKSWNKVLIPVEGELKEGSKVTYEFYQEENGKAAVMGATVKEMTPTQLINQAGGMPLVMTFDHKYILEPVGEGTKVTIHEDYRGVMVPFWSPLPVEKAYERLLILLEEEVTD